MSWKHVCFNNVLRKRIQPGNSHQICCSHALTTWKNVQYVSLCTIWTLTVYMFINERGKHRSFQLIFNEVKGFSQECLSQVPVLSTPPPTTSYQGSTDSWSTKIQDSCSNQELGRHRRTPMELYGRRKTTQHLLDHHSVTRKRSWKWKSPMAKRLWRQHGIQMFVNYSSFLN